MRPEQKPKGYDVESYGGGFIVCDYSGQRGEAAYCGTDGAWRTQPIGIPPFATWDEAWDFARKDAEA